jgi:hypothetical protein
MSLIEGCLNCKYTSTLLNSSFGIFSVLTTPKPDTDRNWRRTNDSFFNKNAPVLKRRKFECRRLCVTQFLIHKGALLRLDNYLERNNYCCCIESAAAKGWRRTRCWMTSDGRVSHGLPSAFKTSPSINLVYTNVDGLAAPDKTGIFASS